MPRDQNRNEQLEWVNAWAAASMKTGAGPVFMAEPALSGAPPQAPDAAAPELVAAPLGQSLPSDQLMLDVAEIERTRDALAALPVATFSARRGTQALMLIP